MEIPFHIIFQYFPFIIFTFQLFSVMVVFVLVFLEL
jgi:hypothetical protein